MTPSPKILQTVGPVEHSRENYCTVVLHTNSDGPVWNDHTVKTDRTNSSIQKHLGRVCQVTGSRFRQTTPCFNAHIYIYTCAYMYVHISLYTYMYTYMCMFMHIHIYIYACMICIYIYTCKYIPMYIYLQTCIRMYAHIWQTSRDLCRNDVATR